MRLVERYSELLEKSDQVGAMTVLRFVRLMWKGTRIGVELFHVVRDGMHFQLEWELGGSGLSYNVKASGPQKVVERAFSLALDNYLKGTAGTVAEYGIVSERMDSDAERHLKVFEHPTFGVKWGEYQPDTEEGMEARDFLKILDRQLGEWLQAAKLDIRALRHPYWPTFREMVREAIRQKYGDRFTLYRGVYGKQARDVIDGKDLVLRPLSSWTSNRDYAKEFVLGTPGGASGGRKQDWAVVSSEFTPKNILFAPVQLPDFKPKPDVLARNFVYEQEFIVHNRRKVIRAGNFKVAFRTRRKRR